MQDPTILLPQVQPMLYRLAWETARKCPVEFEEALSEAYFAFMKACETYNPNKSKFSTWCYFWTWTHLKTWITKKASDRLVLIEDASEDLKEDSVKAFSLSAVVDVSGDAEVFLSLLLSAPEDLGIALNVCTPRQWLARVRELLSRDGWTQDRIAQAENMIRSQLRKAWQTP